MNKKNVMKSCVIVGLGLVALTFNNCGKMRSPASTAKSAGLSSASSTKEEDALVLLLNKAADRSAYLFNLEETLKTKQDKESNAGRRNTLSNFRKDLIAAASQLADLKDKVLGMLQKQRLAISSNEVLSQVDFLVLALAEARSLQIEIELREEIGRVELEAKERDAALQAQIDTLEKDLAAAKADVDKFKAQVNSRFKGLDDQIALVNTRLNLIDQLIADYKASSEAADAALALALGDLRTQTQKQIVELTDLNAKLKEDIIKQKTVLDELFKSQAGVASISGRLCTVDANGNKTDIRARCTGSEADLYTTNVCCLNISDVDCGVMFPSEVQLTARNQCNIMIATIKNHDEQLKAIREVDTKQTALIDGLLSDVENLSKQVAILADGYKLLQQQVNLVAAKVANIDDRLLIVEFKAARAEAAAALNERSDLNLAWIARRSTDVSQRFCSSNVRQSLDQFDYEAARQNWHYCKERLEFLTRAKELTQLAKAYTNGLQSVNVDSSCAATVDGKPAESLTNAELLSENTYKQVMEKCTTGGPVVARALILNVVQLQGVIGPDFRTVGYMMKKAKIAQLAYLGKLAADTSAQERADFELLDPTDAKISKTLYGRIERPFQKRYAESRMRTMANTFPERPSDIPENIAGFDTIWSQAQIKSGSNAFFNRLAALEIKGSCSDCGFMVTGRANTDVNVSTGGKERFAYPKDVESLCPVMDDVVVLKNSSGKYLPYRMNYDGMREDLQPYLRNGWQPTMASSDADVVAGNFPYCGRHADYLVSRNGLDLAQLKSRAVLTATTPYGNTYAGRGACIHTTIVCVLRDEEWKAPVANYSADLISYLSGYDGATLKNKCNFNVGSKSVVRTIALSNDYKSRMSTFSSAADSASVALQAKITDSTSQLTSNYWTLRDNVLTYGVGNTVSKASPFFGSAQSHSNQFIRKPVRLTKDVSVQECTPNE